MSKEFDVCIRLTSMTYAPTTIIPEKKEDWSISSNTDLKMTSRGTVHILRTPYGVADGKWSQAVTTLYASSHQPVSHHKLKSTTAETGWDASKTGSVECSDKDEIK